MPCETRDQNNQNMRGSLLEDTLTLPLYNLDIHVTTQTLIQSLNFVLMPSGDWYMYKQSSKFGKEVKRVTDFPRPLQAF